MIEIEKAIISVLMKIIWFITIFGKWVHAHHIYLYQYTSDITHLFRESVCVVYDVSLFDLRSTSTEVSLSATLSSGIIEMRKIHE